MPQIGPKHIRIKVDAETGAWEVKKDSGPHAPDEIDPKDLDSIAQGLRFVGVILHHHESPG
jgi:hypothetical protein